MLYLWPQGVLYLKIKMTEAILKLLEKIKDNKRVRQTVASESPFWFSLLYLRHHFKYPFAPFHLEMFHLIQNPKYQLIVAMAFRDSGKSTIMNLINALWSILGKPEKKFIVIISKTQEQAKIHFANIKYELENNEALKQDFGPFTENEKGLEKKLSLELEYHGSKIISVSKDQSIRGLKHMNYRPDLIIADDLEDIDSANNVSECDALYRRFQSEIIPLGSNDTRIVLLGNLLSENSFIMKIRKDIEQNIINGIYRAYPLLDDMNKNLWPGKFIGAEDVDNLKDRMSHNIWKREYLLNMMTKEPSWGDDWHITPKQIALINQMSEFKISAPLIGEFIKPEVGDPRYERYQEYLKEVDKMVYEFNERMRIILIGKPN